MDVTVVTNVLDVVTVEVALEYTEILYDVAVGPLDVQVTAPLGNDSATLVGRSGRLEYASKELPPTITSDAYRFVPMLRLSL